MFTVLVPLAQGCEEIEAVTIIDVLRRADISVTCAGLDSQAIRASRGTILQADCTLDQALEKPYDMIVLPGGQPGTRNLHGDARILNLISTMAQQNKYVCAICAAPSILASIGLLDGKNATSYPGALNDFPLVHQKNLAVVEDGKFITSRSPGTAMDFALTLVERLAGNLKRKEVETALERDFH